MSVCAHNEPKTNIIMTHERGHVQAAGFELNRAAESCLTYPGPLIFPARYLFATDRRPSFAFMTDNVTTLNQTITNMDSTQVKAAVIKQVQQEANLVNARTLIEVRPFHNSLPSSQD